MAFFERWLDPTLQRVMEGPGPKDFTDHSEESSLEIFRFLDCVCDTFTGFDVPSDVQGLVEDDLRDTDGQRSDRDGLVEKPGNT
ncbi:hypothetical protein GTO89_04940 [Heliobacterium gestii]|uniref:Uncharacterized protein n=1 Tax=Heliomicrobium gestii TaxID=2699 RepID=A0A845L6S9_HELGE|nr:hypothetical protein [Heliomicrobium gestii]MBM7866964.1 hypothetical protein [Heliomicrobium gestii]MZP42387.1 hypothetical protein [Heliomicrobium gestii]